MGPDFETRRVEVTNSEGDGGVGCGLVREGKGDDGGLITGVEKFSAGLE